MANDALAVFASSAVNKMRTTITVEFALEVAIQDLLRPRLQELLILNLVWAILLLQRGRCRDFNPNCGGSPDLEVSIAHFLVLAAFTVFF